MSKPIDNKIEVFPIYSRNDAAHAIEIMHKLFNKKDTDAEAARIYYAFEQLLDNFESKQVQLQATISHVLITEILASRELSKREFALMLGTSETALSAILSGSRPISERMAHRIAKALSIDPQVIKTTRNKTTAA